MSYLRDSSLGGDPPPLLRGSSPYPFYHRRSAELRQSRRPKRSFSDRDVCKAYLCGFCPEDEFARTKYELGQCQYTHDEKCKEQVSSLIAIQRMLAF